MVLHYEAMGDRMARVETQLENIEKKLDEFIQSADRKYAPAYITATVKQNCKDIEKHKKLTGYLIGAGFVVWGIVQILIQIYF